MFLHSHTHGQGLTSILLALPFWLTEECTSADHAGRPPTRTRPAAAADITDMLKTGINLSRTLVRMSRTVKLLEAPSSRLWIPVVGYHLGLRSEERCNTFLIDLSVTCMFRCMMKNPFENFLLWSCPTPVGHPYLQALAASSHGTHVGNRKCPLWDHRCLVYRPIGP